VCVCILNLVIQRAWRMRLIISSSVAHLAVAYFAHDIINGAIFEEKLLNTKYVF